MKEIRFFYAPDASRTQELPEEEAKHAVKVLRLKDGDSIYLTDGTGGLFEAVVTMVSPKHCMYEITRRIDKQKEWHGAIHLAIAPTKMMERMEWMAEKATEIGFDELSFLSCKFSERKTLREDRIERIVVSAMKQSHKATKPVVNKLAAFTDFVSQPRPGRLFIAHCYEEIGRKDLFGEFMSVDRDVPVTVLVGPEGDFSIDEVKLAMAHGYEPISLGLCRLRTETAGLSAVMMANLSKRRTAMDSVSVSV